MIFFCNSKTKKKSVPAGDLERQALEIRANLIFNNINFIKIGLNANRKSIVSSSAFLYSPNRPNHDPTWTVLVCACALAKS
jgi:hypothetical protein